MNPTIGYYVHHHGTGHLRRAQLLLAEVALPAVVLTSAPVPAGTFGANVCVLELPTDVGDTAVVDPTANGRLHWAPLDPSTLSERVRIIADTIRSESVTVMVCDVSVEVAVLARLCGVAPIVVRQHGRRNDPAHVLAFDIAHRILAPFPQELDTARPPGRQRQRTFYTGLLTKNSSGRPMSATGNERELVIATGGGETGLSAASIAAAADALPRWRIRIIGQLCRDAEAVIDERANLEHLGWVSDPHAVFASASVVAASAGSNLVADVASANRPLIAVAEERPFHEQCERLRALRRCDAAVGDTAWPIEVDQWRDCVDRAMRLGSRRLAGMIDQGAAASTARWLEETAIDVSKADQWA